MAFDFVDERQQAHAYLDQLPPEQLSAVRGLLETMLSPLERKLALAPIDDEPLNEEEASAIHAGADSLDQGRSVPMEEVLADFGLTMDNFQKMADTPLAEEPKQ